MFPMFRVLAQMLDLQNKGQVPNDYRIILTLLLTPASRQQEGRIPGLVRPTENLLGTGQCTNVCDRASWICAGSGATALDTFQLNDVWGFEFLQSVFLNVNT
jgi:exportin-2 (importin alpha re-exporter)